MPDEPAGNLVPRETAMYAVMGIVDDGDGTKAVGNPDNLPVASIGGWATLAEFVTSARQAGEIDAYSERESYGTLSLSDDSGRLLRWWGFRDQTAFDKAVQVLRVPPFQPVSSQSSLTVRAVMAERLRRVRDKPGLTVDADPGDGDIAPHRPAIAWFG